MQSQFFFAVDRQVTAVVIVTALVLIVNQLARLRRTSLLHKSIREAISANSPLAPQLINQLNPSPTVESDSRTGAILLAVAVALILFGLIAGPASLLRSFAATAMFPASVGIVLLARTWVQKSKSASDS